MNRLRKILLGLIIILLLLWGVFKTIELAGLIAWVSSLPLHIVAEALSMFLILILAYIGLMTLKRKISELFS